MRLQIPETRYETTVQLQEKDSAKYTPNALETVDAPEAFLKAWAARHSILRWGQKAPPEGWKDLVKKVQRSGKKVTWKWEYYKDGLPKVPNDFSEIDIHTARELYSQLLRIHFSTDASSLSVEFRLIGHLQAGRSAKVT